MRYQGSSKETRGWLSASVSFMLGALAGVPIGMIWSWVDYGSFQLGYMSNHVLGSALLVGLLALGITLLRRWLHRNPM